MADIGSILVTGAAGQLGAVGRTVTGLLLDRRLPVRAMVRREDDRAAALRATGEAALASEPISPPAAFAPSRMRPSARLRRCAKRVTSRSCPAGVLGWGEMSASPSKAAIFTSRCVS